MAIDILMPALSPTMEEGKLAKWLKKEGDKVKPGDVLAEIETDKATMEVEAIDEGMLAKILVSDGTDNVAVNTPIAVLAGEGEDVSTAAARQPAAARAAGGADAGDARRRSRRPPGGAATFRPRSGSACRRRRNRRTYDADRRDPGGHRDGRR